MRIAMKCVIAVAFFLAASILSGSRPASASSLYLAWRGADGDQGIYAVRTSTLGPANYGFNTSCKIPNAGTATGVSLTTLGNKVYMAWRGVGDDKNIYWSRLNSADVCHGWEAQHRLSDRGTASVPAIAVYNGKMVMVWRGIDDDRGIYWSQFDGNTSWSPQQKVPGIGTDSITTKDPRSIPIVAARPGLAAYNGLLYMAWRGIGDDQNIYWTTFDGKRWNPAPQQHRLGDRGTFASPALGVYWGGNAASPVASKKPARGQQLLMVWPGIALANNAFGHPGSYDLCVYWSTFDPKANNFRPQARTPNDFHAVNQVALQNVLTGGPFGGGKLFLLRSGNDTSCLSPPLSTSPTQNQNSNQNAAATLGAIDYWSPPTNADDGERGWSLTGAFSARLSGGAGMTAGP